MQYKQDKKGLYIPTFQQRKHHSSLWLLWCQFARLVRGTRYHKVYKALVRVLLVLIVVVAACSLIIGIIPGDLYTVGTFIVAFLTLLKDFLEV